MNLRWGLVFGIIGFSLSSPAWADRDTAKYTSLTVFGDSLVDAGNYYIATKGVSPGGPYPDTSKGYFQNRLTNGYDYPDLLSQDLFGEPTKPSLAGGSNFAIAGARIINTGDPIPDLQLQIGAWHASQEVDPNGLYILNFGANDVFGALGFFLPDYLGSYSDTTSYFQAAAQLYAGGIQALNDLGVRNILVTDAPLVGNPFTTELNGYLNAALAGLTLDSDTDLMVYSLSDFNSRLLSDPAAFGLPAPLRTDSNCIAEGAQASGCEGFFSFDGVHPTAAVQAAGYADLNARFNLTASVPEPATWAMMLVGFAVIGGAMRRRGGVAKLRYA